MKKIYRPEYLCIDLKFKRGQGVVVFDDQIIEIGDFNKMKTKYKEAQVEDWRGMVMMAGTVNVHNHCFQSLLRGLFCDRSFLEWRDEALYKYSPQLKQEHIYAGAVFAFSEMMKCGVTTVSDFLYLHNYGTQSDEMIVKAAKDVGIRLVLARTMCDRNSDPQGYVESVDEAVANTRALALKYKNDDMVTVLPAPHSLHVATTEMIQAGAKLAKELGTCFHIHVAEDLFEVEQVMARYGGLTPIELLDKLGVVNERMVIVHGVWLKESEIATLGKKRAKLAYCPSSNMFLADGITNLPAMKKASVLIGLGSDGACSNNRISVFEEMRMAALLQKAKNLDAMCIDYKDAFKMGTENGARLLELPVGSIEVGRKADFVGITAETMSMQPISDSMEQILPNIVYSMQPDAIARVVVNGELTVENGKLLRVPEGQVIEGVHKTIAEIGV